MWGCFAKGQQCMSLSNLSPSILFGVIVVVAVIVWLLTRKPAPVADQPVSRKPGLGLFTWILIILAFCLTLYNLPWLFAHVPLSNKPVVLPFSSPSAPSPTPPAHGTRAYYVWFARQAALEVHYNPDAFVNQIETESHFSPSAHGSSGEIGIAQFMPATARAWGVNPADPESSLKGAARMMASYLSRYGGDYAKALAAYNAGAVTTDQAIARGGAHWKAYLPLVTQRYIAKILTGVQV